MVMRRVLGSVLPVLLLVGLLGACGDDETGTATDDPAPTASSTPTDEPTDPPTDQPTEPTDVPTDRQPGDPVEFELVQTITETAAGGEASPTAVPLGDDGAVQSFIAGFNENLQTGIQDVVAATDIPDDMVLYGATIWVGCESPTQVEVFDGASGLEIYAVQVRKQMECFAPMTTVALVLIPASAAG